MSNTHLTTFVGLDAHSQSIHVSVLRPGAESPPESWQVAHDDRSLRRLARQLLDGASGEVVAAYEAGPCGYALQRKLQGWGIDCRVVAPSLIPVRPGERVKTDRRDARKLASLLKGGLLTEVRPPDEASEALRDLTRAREDAVRDRMSARHRVGKMLLRHGLRFTETKSWTKRHQLWLRQVRFGEAHAQQAFDHYLLALEQADERVRRLDAALAAASGEEAVAGKVGWLRCFRGIDTVTAMTLLAELHDPRRFRTAAELMSYLGLTPSEHSSGKRVQRGGITKAGNGHVRKMLIETAWNYRFRPTVSGVLKKRREGQPGWVVAMADAAQQRLCQRHRHLRERLCKPHNVANTAVARELAGVLWAVLVREAVPAAA